MISGHRQLRHIGSGTFRELAGRRPRIRWASAENAWPGRRKFWKGCGSLFGSHEHRRKRRCDARPSGSVCCPWAPLPSCSSSPARPTTLRNLILDETPISDTGLVHLQELIGLQFLSLYGTRVTDAGLVHLHGLKSLRELYLSGAQITDAGLAEVKNLTGLRFLSLYDTRVTDDALAKLQLESPDLRVQELKPR